MRKDDVENLFNTLSVGKVIHSRPWGCIARLERPPREVVSERRPRGLVVRRPWHGFW